jgi:hypothetical protein
MADEKVPVYNEKNTLGLSSDVEDGSVSSPAPEFDDLPDPDVGKSDEERAKLVCLFI